MMFLELVPYPFSFFMAITICLSLKTFLVYGSKEYADIKETDSEIFMFMIYILTEMYIR